jgi:predicted lipid-binding transport protein (Tim44 family)
MMLFVPNIGHLLVGSLERPPYRISNTTVVWLSPLQLLYHRASPADYPWEWTQLTSNRLFVIHLSTSCQPDIKLNRLLLVIIKAENCPSIERRRMPMNTKRISIILVLLVAMFTVSACASKNTPNAQKLAAQGIAAENKSDIQKVVYATAPAAAYATQAPRAVQAQGDEQTAASGEVAMLNYQSSSVRMVIKDAEIELLVEDTDRAIDQVTQLTADYGGYLISSQSWYDGEFKYAAIRLAVPSQSFETALTNLRHLGVKVVRETGSGQDVSAEYTDLQSRLTNLEATAARVREFLNAAQTVEESLRVNQQLSELEAQIEQIKGQMKYYEGRSAFSTITANLVPQRPTPTPAPTATPTSTPTPTATPTPKPSWNPGHTFSNASGVLGSLLRATVDLLIWLIVVFGPFLVIVVVAVLLLDRILHLRIRLQSSRRPSPSLPAAPAPSVNPDQVEQ